MDNMLLHTVIGIVVAPVRGTTSPSAPYIAEINGRLTAK